VPRTSRVSRSTLAARERPDVRLWQPPAAVLARKIGLAVLDKSRAATMARRTQGHLGTSTAADFQTGAQTCGDPSRISLRKQTRSRAHEGPELGHSLRFVSQRRGVPRPRCLDLERAYECSRQHRGRSRPLVRTRSADRCCVSDRYVSDPNRGAAWCVVTSRTGANREEGSPADDS